MASVADLLQRLFVPREPAEDDGGAPALLVTVECGSCGEFVRTRIDKASDLQAVYGQEDRPAGYLLTKEMVGARCRNLIRIVIRFDVGQRPREVEVEGGHLVHLECTD